MQPPYLNSVICLLCACLAAMMSSISSYDKLLNFAMTVISQDDHLTAGAWAACVESTRGLLSICIILLNKTANEN